MMYWHFNADVKAAGGVGGGGGGSGNMLGKTKRREGEKKKGAEREEEGEVEGCYKCSGEIWETVQDFHYL